MPGHYGAPKGGGAGKKPSLGSKYKPLPGKPAKPGKKAVAKPKKPIGGPGAIKKPIRPVKPVVRPRGK